MSSQSNYDKRGPVTSDLHPVVYSALLGFVLLLVLAVWGFARDSYADYLLASVSGFIFIFVAIPATLYLMARSQQDEQGGERGSFRDWRKGEFDTWQDQVKGTNAVIEILLPIAAIAIGMTAFAIVLYFTAPAA